MCSPEALLIWPGETILFTLDSVSAKDIVICAGRGDVKLHKTASGAEELEFNERQTKARTGSDYSDVRVVPPKMSPTDGTERDPVAAYSFLLGRDLTK